MSSAVEHAARLGADAVLFNCCQPEVIGAAVVAAKLVAGRVRDSVLIGAYANAFAPQSATANANAELDDLRVDLGPAEYLQWVRQWLADGADIVGGCCGVGPEHIALIRGALGEIAVKLPA